MAKVRSKRLYQFLIDRGALNASKEEIMKVKAEYRKLYKKAWKKKRNVPRKEIRPCFSLKEYLDIQVKAHELGVCPTRYVKQVVLSGLHGKALVPHTNVLKKVLQLLGIAQNSYGDAVASLPEAEKLLFEYLKAHDC